MPTPLLILSDSPSSKSGLGRITRELAIRIHEHMGDVYRVGCVGPGFDDRIFMPFPNYPLHEMENWCVTELPEIWRTFAGNERGILLVIWDASRLLWLVDPAKYCKPAPHITNPETVEKYANLRTFLQSNPFEIWTYTAIDAEGPNGKLSYLIREVLSKCDRVLAYSEWSARIIERTIGGKVESLPHGIDPVVWRPRGRDKARRKFGQLVFDTDFSIKPNLFVIGIVGTNQARKDFGTAIAAAAELAKVQDVLLWIHTDTMERFWSISALLVDYGLQNQAVVTTGRLTDEQMTWAYSACDVTWGIGLGEGFGFPIYESLACGVPCIHGNYGGGAEWLPDEFKIEPVAFRHEGTFNSMRPIYMPHQWAEKTLTVIGASANLPPELNWNNLWPRWNVWLRKEQMYPTHATPELVNALAKSTKQAEAPGDLGKPGHVWLPELVNPSTDPAELNCGITAVGDSDFRVYMRVENRFDLLDKAVASIPEFWPLLSIVDNSPNGMCDGLPPEITIMRGPVPLTFTQSHNWFYKDAKEKGAKFILWMHTDAEAVNNGHLRLLDFVREQCVGKRKWGLAWTSYDSLTALNLDMIAEVGGYDTIFPKYFCDNDHTRRMRLAGWETIDTSIVTMHIGSQSIFSDPKAKFLNDVTFPLYQQYYIKKWGGPVDHETFTKPFNGRLESL